ncbi:hypothetical protein JTE90_007871 [Oedothorax gibbosus]|uniref:Uncharacterized protein n=1 Tax=Oedothorax gibbosus TaxID=931172 RepID=A0AAV6VKQ0_9ARAC|nr:hypothetical protein JTE90_007871 [Oedothorax gibbosus]
MSNKSEGEYRNFFKEVEQRRPKGYECVGSEVLVNHWSFTSSLETSFAEGRITVHSLIFLGQIFRFRR